MDREDFTTVMAFQLLTVTAFPLPQKKKRKREKGKENL